MSQFGTDQKTGQPTLKLGDSFTPAEQDIIDVFWDALPKVREHPDRRYTGWGSKTKIGLVATVKRLGRGLEE